MGDRLCISAIRSLPVLLSSAVVVWLALGTACKMKMGPIIQQTFILQSPKEPVGFDPWTIVLLKPRFYLGAAIQAELSQLYANGMLDNILVIIEEEKKFNTIIILIMKH